MANMSVKRRSVRLCLSTPTFAPAITGVFTGKKIKKTRLIPTANANTLPRFRAKSC